VDLVLVWPWRRQPQRRRSDPPRNHVARIEEGVDPVGKHLLEEGRVVDAVHDDEQLVERQGAAHPAEHAWERLVDDPGQPREEPGGGDRPLGALREQTLPPGARLEDQVARGRLGAEPSVEAVVLEVVDAGPRRHRSLALAERLAPTANGVDLVDEDDALTAPLAGELLRLARHVADATDVQPG